MPCNSLIQYTDRPTCLTECRLEGHQLGVAQTADQRQIVSLQAGAWIFLDRSVQLTDLRFRRHALDRPGTH